MIDWPSSAGNFITWYNVDGTTPILCCHPVHMTTLYLDGASIHEKFLQNGGTLSLDKWFPRFRWDCYQISKNSREEIEGFSMEGWNPISLKAISCWSIKTLLTIQLPILSQTTRLSVCSMSTFLASDGPKVITNPIFGLGNNNYVIPRSAKFVDFNNLPLLWQIEIPLFGLSESNHINYL